MVEVSIAVDSTRYQAYVRKHLALLHIARCGALRNDARGLRSDSILSQTERCDRAACHDARSLRRIHLPRSSATTARSEPHSVPPIHRRHERQRTTNRRSTWAGVSWPNEDAHNAGELDELRRTRVAIRRRQLMPELTTRSARSCGCSRGKPHARSSSPSGAGRRWRSINVKS